MTTHQRLSAAVLALLLASCSGEADFSDVIETGTLDAEAYREEILEIDRLVFAAEAMDAARREALVDRFEKLAARVAGQKPEKFMKLESLELRALGKRAGRAGSARSMTDLQNQWMRIRNNLFDDQWWFARSAADLEATATMSVASTSASEDQPIATPVPDAGIAEGEAPRSYEPLSSSGVQGMPAGRWSVEAIFANGAQRSDPEMSGATWEFHDGTLSIIGDSGTERYSCELSGESLHLRSLEPSGGGPPDGWMLVRRSGDVMHAAFYDNLTRRPTGFLHEPGNAELLIVVVLRKR